MDGQIIAELIRTNLEKSGEHEMHPPLMNALAEMGDYLLADSKEAALDHLYALGEALKDTYADIKYNRR